MKITIAEGEYSESFLKKVKSFLTPIIKSEVTSLVKESLLWVGLSIPKIDENGFMYYGIIDVMVAKAALSIWGSKTQLHWRSSDGKNVLSSDDVSEKELIFWIENMPSQERTHKVVERNDYMWKRDTKLSTINKKLYRFNIREMGWFGSTFPDIGIRIKTSVELDILSKFIGDTIEAYNQQSLSKENFHEDDMNNLGLIHSFSFEKKKKNVYLFTIDMGSALDGVDAILQALNNSNLEVELVTLE